MGRHTVLDYQPCQVPLRTISVFGVRITVHEGIVADCREAERRWLALGGARWYPIEQHHTGSYNCRNSVGHSRAVAIDFNWQRNGYVRPRPANPRPGVHYDPQMPEFYEKCWRPLGYGWGGNWRSAYDPMHISKVRSEGGDGILYRQHATERSWLEMASKQDVVDAVVQAMGGHTYRQEHPGSPVDMIYEISTRARRIEATLKDVRKMVSRIETGDVEPIAGVRALRDVLDRGLDG